MANIERQNNGKAHIGGGLFSRNMLILCAVFLAVNVAMCLLSVPGGALKFGADSADYYVPAQALYEHGALNRPGDMNEMKYYRTPGYQIFLAAIMWLTNGSPISLVIGLQAAMLLLTGLAAKSITENWLPGYGDATLGLVVFNPNALISSQLIQTDTLMSMLFVMAVWSIDRYLKTKNLWAAVFCGLFLGLSCLVRPTPQYLIALLPIAFPLATALTGDGRSWHRHITAGVLAAAVASVTVLPWIYHMAGQGEGYTISSARVKFVFVMDNVLILEQLRSGRSQVNVSKILRQREATYAKSIQEDWAHYSNAERYKHLTSFHLKTLAEFPISILAKAAIISASNMFVGGGSANYHRLLGLEHRTPGDISAKEKNSNFFHAFLNSLLHSSPIAAAFSAFAIGFAAIMRILGVIGLIVLITRRHWPLLLVIASVVSYFALIHIIVSSARYRLPIEPPLLILALFGLDSLRARLFGTSR